MGPFLYPIRDPKHGRGYLLFPWFARDYYDKARWVAIFHPRLKRTSMRWNLEDWRVQWWRIRLTDFFGYGSR